MLSAHNILLKIEAILDELLVTAEKLQHSSLTVIAEEEIIALQQSQDALMNELQELDTTLHKEFPEAIHKKSKEQISIHKKLEAFQKINSQFIDTLRLSPGLIKFEIHEKKKK